MSYGGEYDVVVVGSGFGGSVAALRAAEKRYSVCVLEAGRRFRADDFPRTNWNVRRYVFAPRLGCRGTQRLTLLRDVLVLSGAGVGGGSLVYANVLHRPLPSFWVDPAWPNVTDWRAELEPYYGLASGMLGRARVPEPTPADDVMREVAGRLGVAHTFKPTDVGVYFGERGREVEDPYFGGAGPPRRGCIGAGACMIGCRHGAKNSLDLNYLWLAEGLGAVVRPEREVVDVVPRPGGGYAVVSRRPGWRGGREVVHARQVVFAAGALGTLKLLLTLRERGRLPRLSSRLGERFRTNSEALVGATARTRAVDYSQGVAITSEFHPDDRTHIQPVRYPRGSNAMGLLGTVLVDGGGRVPRQLRFGGAVARHPLLFARSLSVYRWSERTIILLVMQARDTSLRVRLRRGRLRTEQGEGEPNPTFIPVANEAARITADVIGGVAGSALNEVLLDVPTTAHVLGGATLGATDAEGVVDPYHRVHAYPDLHVVDASAVVANPGANPALTIAAQAERALALWPNRDEPDPRPAQGDAYLRIVPVAPASPAVPEGAPATMPWAVRSARA